MDDQYYKELLRDRGLKATTNRINVLTKIQEYQSAMPYSEIQETLNDMDRVTLYRTLESLKEQGIIHHAFHGSNETYYAICGQNCGKKTHRHDHIHFKCTSCNTVSCEKPDETIQVSLKGTEVRKVSVFIEGICSICKMNRIR